MIWEEGEEDEGAAGCQNGQRGRLCTAGQCAQHAQGERALETEAETEMSRDRNTKAVDGECTVDTRESDRRASGNECYVTKGRTGRI